MKITCKHCGIVNKPHRCPHSKRKPDRNRLDKKIYRTMRWQNKREDILEDYNYMCLWSLYIYGEVRAADTVHHIIEVLEDESLAYEDDNLIPLDKYKHREVHELYNKNKSIIQTLLRKMKEDYKNGDLRLGKYKNSF